MNQKKRKLLVANQKLIHMSEDAEGANRKIGFFMSEKYFRNICYTPYTNLKIYVWKTKRQSSRENA